MSTPPLLMILLLSMLLAPHVTRPQASGLGHPAATLCALDEEGDGGDD